MSAWLKELERLYAPHPVPWALRAYLSASAHTNPSLAQAGFRLRNDDGSQTAATWVAAENTNATLSVDTNYRARFVVDEGAGGAENVQFKLQYNLNAAGWNDVNGTSLVVRSAASGNFAEGDATTRQLTSGFGTFLAGKMDEVDGATNVNTSFAGGELTEHEFCFQIRSADVVNNDSLQLRLVRSTAVVLEVYTQTPTITVSEAGGTTFFQTLPATAVGVAVLSRITTFARTLAATAVGVATLTSASVIGKTLTATAVGVATLSTALLTSVPLAATAVGVATLSRVATYSRALAATAVGVATLAKKMFVILGATAVGVPAMVKGMFKTLAATATALPTLTPALLATVSMAATAVGVATLNAAQLILQTMAATAVGVASLTAQFIAGTGAAICLWIRKRWIWWS